MSYVGEEYKEYEEFKERSQEPGARRPERPAC
jgi:hypothetical protein